MGDNGEQPQPGERLIFIGLFPTFIPQGRPAGGTLLASSDLYNIGPVPDGQYYVFAAAFPLVKDLLSYLLPEADTLLVGAGKRRAVISGTEPTSLVDVMLRPVQITDPPILIALPFLLTEILAG